MRKRSPRRKHRLRRQLLRAAEIAGITFVAWAIPALTLSDDLAGLRDVSAFVALTSLMLALTAFSGFVAVTLQRSRARRKRREAHERSALEL
jgi:hypothetical protein